MPDRETTAATPDERQEWASNPLGATVRPPGPDDGPLFVTVWHDVVEREAAASR